MIVPQFDADTLEDIQSFGFDHMGKMFTGISIVPSPIIVIVLVVLSPVPMQPTVQSRMCRNDLRDLVRICHIVICLSLVEFINAGFIYLFAGQRIIFATAFRVRIGKLACRCDIE